MSIERVVEEGLTRTEVLKGAAGIVGGGAVIGFLAACGGSDESSTNAATTTNGARPKTGGVMRISLSGTSSDTLDVAKVEGGGGNACLCAAVYSRLVLSDGQFEIHPSLAEKWESNADGTVWTFHLRPNLVFADGSPLTTKDVAAQVKRVLDEKVGSKSFALVSESLKGSGVAIVDDQTITFNLSSANGQFPLVMADRALGIPKASTATDRIPVGSGAFKVKAFDAGRSWSVERNPKYFEKGRPYLDGVECVVNNDVATVLRSVTSGNTDLGGIIDFGQAESVKSTSNTQLLESKNAYFIYAILDPKLAPFDNPKVIEAVKIAVDRQAIVNSAFAGFGDMTSDIMLWPSNPAYPPDLGVRPQDIEKAKALLSEAGHPNGIDLVLYTAPAYGGMVDFATAFAQVVEPAGIRVKIQQEDPGTYWSNIEFKKPMYVSTIGTRPPLLAISYQFQKNSPLPEPHFDNPEVDKLTSQAIATVDKDQRNALTGQALQIIADEAGISIPAALPQLYAAKKGVSGVELNPSDLARFTNASLG